MALFGRYLGRLPFVLMLAKLQRGAMKPAGNRNEQPLPPGEFEMTGELPVDFKRAPIVCLPAIVGLEERLLLVAAHFEMRAGALRLDVNDPQTIEFESVSAWNVVKGAR